MAQDIYMLIQKKYLDLQKQARTDCDNRIAHLYAEHPMLKQITDEVASANSRLICATLKRQNRAVTEALSDELEKLKAKRDEYIKNNNIDMSVFKPRFACDMCNDTGKLPNGTRCTCFTDYYAQMKFAASDMSILERENFSKFDLSVFPEKTPNGIPQREQMERIRNALYDYCVNFPDVKKKNILISGRTGTGKSFLLNCIAKELSDRLFPTIRLSAYKMVNELFDKYIDDSTDFNSELERLCETDVLIIDDLGTELMKENFTHNTLYYILDRRCELNKATIVSTNLNVKQLEEKYSDRIMSRLFNVRITTAIQLQGSDVRIKR